MKKLQNSKDLHPRKAISGIISALILFVMLFTVGSGYFLWVNTNNLIYSQAAVDRNNLNQNQQSENVVIKTALLAGGDVGFRANNSGGSPVILISVFVIDSTGNVLKNIVLSTAINAGGAAGYPNPIDTQYSYVSGTVLVKVLTQRGNAFSQLYPTPPVCPPAPPFCTFANTAGSATSAPIGLLILDFNSYKYYNTVGGCDPGSLGCQLAPWPGGRVAFTMAAQTSFVAFSVNLRNVDPCGRGITLDSDNLFIQFTPPKGTGPGGGTSDAWNWGIGSVSAGGVSQAFPVSGIPIPYNTSAKLFFTVSAAQVAKYPTPGTFVAILIYLHGVTSASTIIGGGCPTVTQAYGQNIPFVTTLYTGTSISISPATGPVGTLVTVTGTSFTASSTVVITYDGVTQTTTTASGTGSFSATFAAPASTAGAHTVIASDGINVGSATFTVTPSITLSPTSGRPGTSVTVSGTGFAPSSTITATFAGNPVTLSGTTTTDATGSFTGATFTVPASAGGAQAVTIRDSSGNAGLATFTVIVASITLSPTSGPVGATVTVTGLNFLPSTAVTITYDGTNVATTTSSGTGSITTTFIVPSGGANPHTVTATDGTYTASTTFVVIAPSITLNPTSGHTGISVTVSGTGFAPSSTITITFNGVTQTTIPATVTTSVTGTFSATFTVPASVAGAQTITATDASTNSASATFTVTPSITLLPTSGPTRTSVAVSGTGFAPSSTITITFNGVTQTTIPATVTTSVTGTFSATFTVPASPAGAQTVTATDASFNTASATFTVTTPSISLNPTSGPKGTTVTVTGSNFVPSSVITITFNGVTQTTIPATVTTSAGGAFSATFTVPASAAGGQTVIATDTSANTASATFTVATSAIILSPVTGPVATTVTVTGSNFLPLSTITITYNGLTLTTTPATITTTAGGAFSATFTVPASTAGAHTVVASDGTNTVSATYTVTPSITLSPTTGPVGTTVTISGTGFAATSTITITYNGVAQTTIPATVTTTAAGSFSATFIVPPSTHGSHMVTATDAGANSASATFSVTSSITLNPITGPAGTVITVTGTGFAATSTITITYKGATQATTPTTCTTTASGSFSCTFVAPSGNNNNGAQTVTATDASGNTASATFTRT